MMIPRRPLSRRTFLRGALGGLGVALALPPLEAMLGPRAAGAQVPAFPPFFGLFYWANGTPWHARHGGEQAGAGYPDLWTPGTTGAGFAPSPLLEPLARHRPTVVTGLEPHTEVPPAPPGQEDGHMRGFMVAMTGDRIRPEGFDHPSHTLTALSPSLDQYLARHPGFYETPPRFRTLEVGVSRARFHDYGHWNAISYNGPDSSNLPIMEPSALFDRLFAVPPDTREADRRRRLLDAVLGDANTLRAQLGATDRGRLDAHLEHVRTLAAPDRGRRRRTARSPAGRATAVSLLREDAHDGRPAGAGRVVRADAGVLRDADVAGDDPRLFDHLGVPEDMHKICHDGRWEWVRDITRYQMECFAAFLDAFQAPQPDGTTLLDRGLVYGTSEYGEGWKHSVKELPVLMVGGAGGRLARGVHVREVDGNLCRAQLTALRALGLDDAQFGRNGAETADVLPGLLT
jgi:hypothetical protein